MKADRFPPLLIPVSVVTGAIFTIVCAAVLIANHGHFAFSFDDPYIHLAMAEEITRGHYGINWSDSAAAASSILYPFLLAPLIALGLGQYAALVLNLAGLGAIAYVVSGLLHDTRLPLAEMPRLPLAIGAAVLSSGVIVLALSGLEHSLQVADALACLWGLMRFLRTHRASGWWLAALIAAPLIRYEGMAILLAGVIVLSANRAWWPALVALVAGLGLVAGFSVFLLHLGLPFLPSSVLAKSGGLAGGGAGALVTHFAATIGTNLQDPRGVFLLIGIAFAGAPFVAAAARSDAPSQWPARAFIGLFVTLVAFAHLALGAYGWFARYETYALLLLVFGNVVIYADALAPRLARATARNVTWASIAILFVSIRMVAMVPASVTATQNIYEQQYQMHRFVTEYWHAPVAVNDLGWVSFQNDDYVLDLYGLGNDEARQIRAGRPATGDWMQGLAEAHDVRLAMIFPEWIAPIPCSWVAVGELQLAGQAVSVPVDHVSFYAVPAAGVAVETGALVAKLKAFAASLPDGVQFRFADLTQVNKRNAYCAD